MVVSSLPAMARAGSTSSPSNSRTTTNHQVSTHAVFRRVWDLAWEVGFASGEVITPSGSPRTIPSCVARWRRAQLCASACCISPHFPPRVWKGGASQGAEGPFQAVIPSPSLSFRAKRGISPCPLGVNCARNLALSVFKTMRDSSSSANKNGGLLGMTRQTSFSAACSAPPLQGPPD
jgi:hypothetical protein